MKNFKEHIKKSDLLEGLSRADLTKIKTALKAGKTVTGKTDRNDLSNKGKPLNILQVVRRTIGVGSHVSLYVTWDGSGTKKNFNAPYISSYSISEEAIEEGTMRAGIFDPDVKKRKDAARKLVFFLKTKRNLKIGPADEKLDGSNKAIDAYIKELMKYVFDDEMIDSLYPTGKNEKQKANDIVVKRLKKMGVKVK